MIRSTIIAMALAVAVAGLVIVPRTADAVTLEQIKSASTPADHAALAAQYEQEAAADRQEAAKHRAMAAAYESGVKYAKVPHSGKGSMKLHCERLAADFEAAAEEADALAAFHRELANKK